MKKVGNKRKRGRKHRRRWQEIGPDKPGCNPLIAKVLVREATRRGADTVAVVDGSGYVNLVLIKERGEIRKIMPVPPIPEEDVVWMAAKRKYRAA